MVRNKIKMFAQKKVTLPPGRHKIVILDEADSMTAAAQQAMRRTIEIYSNTTRFAFACNLSDKIIEAIQSRCAILRYSRLSDAQLLKRILEVAQAESVSYTDEGLEAIIFTAQGKHQSLATLCAVFLCPLCHMYTSVHVHVYVLLCVPQYVRHATVLDETLQLDAFLEVDARSLLNLLQIR